MRYLQQHADAAAAKGAALLDARFPRWWDHIDPALLDLADPRSCVLGQGFAALSNGLTGYDMGRTLLFGRGLHGKSIRDHGFDTPDGVPLSGYDKLTKAWVKIIKARKAPRR